MSLRTTTMVRRPPSLRGVPPRYQVFDRRKSPPMTIGVFYRDPKRDAVVFEVYEDGFRALLERAEGLRGRRFYWMLDVPPGAPADTITEIVVPHPMPTPERRGAEGDPPLTLDEALAVARSGESYRVIRTSDPL
jgi:hypothetical protein